MRTLSQLLVLLLLAVPVGDAEPSGLGPAPAFSGATWLNSRPLTINALRGRVILVEFWTFGCYNCRNVEPYIKRWYRDYRDAGLIVIGVHTPEFAYEQRLENLRNYLRKHAIAYPVVVDNDRATWHAWHNWAWPTIYLVDKQGIVRYRRVGEGGYEITEANIRRLLAE